MLSLIACYSMYGAFPLWVVSWGISEEGRQVGAQRLPRFCLKLWVFTTINAVLAIDFALLVPAMNYRKSGYCLYVADAAVVLVPLLIGVLTRLSVWNLWFVVIFVGLLGMLFLPGIGVR